MKNIWALVVTYNRRELLCECVQALLKTNVHKILIIDNASNDDTYSLFKSGDILNDNRIIYIRLKNNEGGAGGFYWGTRYAYEHGADWVWLMDDDVEPLPDALDMLIDAATQRPKIGFVCSCVRTPDLQNSMNLPTVATKAALGKYPSWDQWLGEGLVKVSAATFVSVMICREAFTKCGFPNRKFFIWVDDLEFTSRLTNSGFTGIMVGKSIVLHKRAQLEALSIITEKNPNRIRMMVNLYQNLIWVKRKDGNLKDIVLGYGGAIRDIFSVIRYSKDSKAMRIRNIIIGIWRGSTYNLKNEDHWKLEDYVEYMKEVPYELPLQAGAM